jgi:hypothetical protein
MYGFSYKQTNLPVYSNLNQIQRSGPLRRSAPFSSGHPQDPANSIVADLAIASPGLLKAIQHLPYSEQSVTRGISPDTKRKQHLGVGIKIAHNPLHGSRHKRHSRIRLLPSVRTPERRRG